MMRLDLRFTIRLGKERKPDAHEGAPETFESQGSLVEMAPQPRYVGYEAIE